MLVFQRVKRAVFCLSGKAGLSAEGGLLGKRRAIMANYIIYPNPAFQPRTDHLPDGTPVAYDAQTDLWATFATGLIYRHEPDGSWTRKHLIGCTPIVPTPNRHSQYPLVHVDGQRSPVTVHSIVARAWLGPIPCGWQIDHIDGDIRNASVLNLRILPPWLNHRDGGFLRKLRHRKIDCPTLLLIYGACFPRDPLERALHIRHLFLRFYDRMDHFRATHTPKQYTRLSRPDLLALFMQDPLRHATANNLAGDVYEGD